MKFTLRQLIYIAVFGALWAAVEMTLGAYLHVLLPPGASYVPLVGPALAALGLAIALVGRRFVPQAGSVFMIAVIAAVLKLLSIGGVKLGPFIGILIEGALAELTLLALRRRGPMFQTGLAEGQFSFVLAGALAVASTIPQKFLFASIFLGRSFSKTFQGVVKQGAGVFGLEMRYALAIIVLLLLIDMILGGLAGVLAWQVGRAAEVRLARR